MKIMQTKQGDFRGKRAELNVYDDCAEFDCQYIINQSHKEGDITVIDDFKITGVSIVEANNND